MSNTHEPWADKEQQPERREGAKFKPVHPEDMTRKEELNRVRGMQDFQLRDKGPSNHSSNPSG